MKKRLLSMLMAVLMIASLVPATALADVSTDKHANHDVLTVNITADPAKKQPGIELVYCNTCSTEKKPVFIKALKVTPFAEASDICKSHDTTTVELQAATCDKPSIKLTYCPVCGTAAKDALYINWKDLGHSFTKFEVVQAPTCKTEGWGYTICDKCGEIAFVNGAGKTAQTINGVVVGGAEYFVKVTNEKATQAEIKAVTDLFAKADATHKDKNAYVAVTEDVYKDKLVKTTSGEVARVVSERVMQAAVEPTHVNTISGKVVVAATGEVSVEATGTTTYFKDAYGNEIKGAGREADKYCAGCGDVVKGKDLPGLNEAHKMDLKHLGYAPYLDKANVKHDGKTDVWSCRDCGKTFGGDAIAYADFYKNAGATLPALTGYVEGDTFLKGAKAAKCETAGYTGDTYTVVDGKWVMTKKGEETSVLGHDLKKIESKAATCQEEGWTCSNYYVCNRIDGYDQQGNPIYCPYKQGNSVIKVVDKLDDHVYAAKTLVAPTCKNTGLEVNACVYCGALEKLQNGKINVIGLKAAPHTAAAELKDAKEATCTEVGYTGDKVCKWCGIVMEKGKEIPMKEHTVVDVAAVEATCTTDGMTAGTKCSVCGTVLSGCEVVKALGHDYKDGKCTRCGEKDPNYVAPEFKDAASIRDYAKDAVAWAAKEGIVKGDDNGNFLPTADITRQDFVTMLWRLKGSVASEKALTFGDKADIKDYAQTAVAWAVENGYIKGRDNGNFDPAAKITRAEIVAILNRIAENAKAEKAADFTDIATHWAKDAIAWAAEAGIVNGVGNNMFAPNDNASRQDTVVMLYKFVNLK